MNNKWDKRYLEIAKIIGNWSKDPSTSVGAVIVGDKGQIISQGYNGFPRNINDEPELYNNRETKYKYIVHAEANALYNALYNGCSVDGSTIYVSGLPCCHECAKAIIQSGINEVVMNVNPIGSRWEESGLLGLELFKEAGLKVKIINE